MLRSKPLILILVPLMFFLAGCASGPSPSSKPVAATAPAFEGGSAGTPASSKQPIKASGAYIPADSCFIPGFEIPGKSSPGAEGGAAYGATYRDPTTGMEFVLVKGGCFQMGSPASEVGRYSDEGPVHEVCVDSFYMGKYEVTNAQYRKYQAYHNSGTYKGHDLNGDRQPVVNVSWNDAQGFIRWLNGQSGKDYRLPTEAEWEYAARGGTRTARFWGDDPDQACKYANVADQTAKRQWSNWTIHNCDDGYAVTAPVGSFAPNPFGLYDMLGNAWEWCSDWYGKDYYRNSPRRNPQGPSTGASRVFRGGSWYFNPWFVRAAYRHGDGPGNRYYYLGFRLVLPLRSP